MLKWKKRGKTVGKTGKQNIFWAKYFEEKNHNLLQELKMIKRILILIMHIASRSTEEEFEDKWNLSLREWNLIQPTQGKHFRLRKFKVTKV